MKVSVTELLHRGKRPIDYPAQDHPCNSELDTARQQRAYRAVRELRAVYVSRLGRRNAPIMDALCLSPPLAVGGWACIYNTAATIRQGAKRGTNATVLKTKLSFNWRSLPWAPAPASAVPV